MITIYGVGFLMDEGRLCNTPLIEKEVDETDHPWCNFSDDFDMMLLPTLNGSFEFCSPHKKFVEVYICALQMAGGLYDVGFEGTLKQALETYTSTKDKELLL